MLEILAPCGSPETLNAALNSGADAVYLGLSSFSARRNAANFSAAELMESVQKAHRQGTRVYVTLNTLVFDDELPEVKKAILGIAEAKADGVIVQDLGAAALVKELVPSLRLHASTQMTVTSASGAEFALKRGFSRVVLPRELSSEEIRKITSKVDIETEVFVHGALCVCLSGQCLLSAVMGGRSGNRGLCAQPCRLNYRCGKRDYALSLKDLSLIGRLKELEEAGVTSAKIEGRMKRPEYVAAAVQSCRRVLSGEKADMELLKTVFSRDGFTESYFDGTMSNMQGTRQKDDSENISGALSSARQLYKEPYKRFTIDFAVDIKANAPISCTAFCGSLEKTVTGDIPQKAINRAAARDDIISRMGKLGGTVFKAGKISVNIESGLSVTVAAINDLRRRAVEGISEEIAKALEGEIRKI